MADDPLVSVVITTFDRPELLERAIGKCLEQSYDNFEILVVDHSGERYAEKIVDDFDGVDYLGTSEELGQIGAWNEGFKQVSGDYVQFHDDDDWLKPSKIGKQADLISESEDVGVVYCGIENDSGEILLPEESNRGNVVEPVLRQKLKQCQSTTMLIDSTFLEELMPLHEFGNVGDLALQIELSQKARLDYVSEPLVYRLMSHDSSGDTLLNRRKRLELIDYYSDIYDKYPKIKKETRQEMNKMLGLKLLEEKRWSLEAIKSFYKVIYYKDEYDIKDITRLTSSIFGSPGLKTGDYLYHNYLSKL